MSESTKSTESTTQYSPLRDYMVLELYEELAKSTLLLPDNAQTDRQTELSDPAATFIVLAVGPGWWEGGKFNESTVREGDRVIMEGAGSVAPVYIDGNEVLLAQCRFAALIIDSSANELTEHSKEVSDNARN